MLNPPARQTRPLALECYVAYGNNVDDRCYCILEGGGAKGVAHIGVLRALEKSGLKLVGFAGTSAGALVATLAAAGYTSADMFGSSGSILDTIDLCTSNSDRLITRKPVTTPKRLLGKGWRGMQLAAHAHRFLLALLAGAILIPWFAYFCGLEAAWAFAAAILLGALAVGLFIQISLGFASVAPVKFAINQALSLKLKGNRDQAPVSFSEFRQLGGRSLKIVAANVDTGKLVLFSAETTPHVAVADAVAASICIPVVFGAWRIGSDRHYDGGLVSNLPAWAFDNERARDRDAWTAAVEISDTDFRRPTVFGLLKAAALTAVFGSSMLNTRSVERLRALRLKVDLKLLQFDFDRVTAARIIDDAERKCEDRLVLQLVDIPQTMRGVCKAIQTAALAIISSGSENDDLPTYAGSVRVGLFRPAPDDGAALINDFSVGFEQSADERLRLPRWDSLPGLVLREGGARFAQEREWQMGLTRPLDRWAAKSLSTEIRWCLCVAHPDRRDLVAWIDGDEALDLDPDAREDILAALADEAATILRQGAPQELFE